MWPLRSLKVTTKLFTTRHYVGDALSIILTSFLHSLICAHIQSVFSCFSLKTFLCFYFSFSDNHNCFLPIKCHQIHNNRVANTFLTSLLPESVKMLFRPYPASPKDSCTHVRVLCCGCSVYSEGL